MCIFPVRAFSTRAFCHLPAGLIRVLQSYVVLSKVIHTTGGSIHTADCPQCCLLWLFSSSRSSDDSENNLSSVFCLCFHQWRPSIEVRGQCLLPLHWHFLFSNSIPEHWNQVRQTGRKGLHRMSSTSSLSPLLLMPSCRAASFCFITVRRLSYGRNGRLPVGSINLSITQV